MKNKIFSGNRPYKPKESVWERIRKERIEELKNLKDEYSSKKLDIDNIDDLELREINDIIRSLKESIRTYRKDLVKEASSINATVGIESKTKMDLIMDLVPKSDRSKVRPIRPGEEDSDGKFSSDQVFEAFNNIVGTTNDRTFTYNSFLKALKRVNNDIISGNDPLDFDTLVPL